MWVWWRSCWTRVGTLKLSLRGPKTPLCPSPARVADKRYPNSFSSTRKAFKPSKRLGSTLIYLHLCRWWSCCCFVGLIRSTVMFPTTHRSAWRPQGATSTSSRSFWMLVLRSTLGQNISFYWFVLRLVLGGIKTLFQLFSLFFFSFSLPLFLFQDWQ